MYMYRASGSLHSSTAKAALLVCVLVISACGGGSTGGATTEAQSIAPSPNQSQEVAQDLLSAPPTPEATVGQMARPEAVAALPLGSTLAWSRTIETTVENFNNWTSPITPFSYTLGPELPGASGSLQQFVSDVDGLSAARLNYDLGCGTTKIYLKSSTSACGRYAALTFRMNTAYAVSDGEKVFLSFDFRNPQSVVNPIVRVIDETGQTLQFSVPGRTIENTAGDAWRRVYVQVDSAKAFWGGANDGKIHGSIKELTIGAGDFSLQQPPGWLDVDNVELSKAPSFKVDLNTIAYGRSTATYSTYVGRLAVASYTSNPVATDKAKAVGIDIVRRDLSWSKVEVAGVYNFDAFNLVASALAAKGMSVLWILDYGHPDHGGATPVTDDDRRAFARFAAAAAKNFKGKNVFAYEVWNEPNGARYWPNKNPYDYAALLNYAAQAIKLEDATAKVVAGGTAGIDFNYSVQLATVANGAYIDAVGVHPYGSQQPESIAQGWTSLNAAIAVNGLNKPVWDTEWGYSSYGDFDAAVYGDGFSIAARNRQAVLVLRRLLSEMAINVPFMTIYNLTDYGSNATSREANFGLMTQDSIEKPAYAAVKSLFNAQNGRIFQGEIRGVPQGVHAVHWRGATDRVIALWVDQDINGGVAIKLPAKMNSLLDWGGGNKMATVISGSISLAEKDGPVFIKVPL